MKNKNNKVAALAFICINALGMLVSKDATMFVFSLMIGLPLFFSRQNWIDW